MTTLLDLHSDLHHNVVIGVVSFPLFGVVICSGSARTISHRCNLQ